MQTPLLIKRKTIDVISLKLDLKRFFNFSILTGLSILLGSVIQIFFSPSRSSIGKDSLITGLPIIRTAFFIFPILFTIATFIWLMVIYKQSEETRSQLYNKWNFLNKVKCGFLFTNFLLMGFFYIIYWTIYIPMNDHYSFKFSGHVLACLFSGSILTNIQTLYEMMRTQNIKRDLMDYMIKICQFLLFHNAYSIFWTSLVFHSIRETVLSFFFAFFWVIFINSLSLDRLLVFLFNDESIKRFRGKEKNKILDNMLI